MIEYYTLSAPLGDALRAEEVANAAAFLSSPLASGVTGTVLFVDKGYHAMAAPGDVEGLVDRLRGRCQAIGVKTDHDHVPIRAIEGIVCYDDFHC